MIARWLLGPAAALAFAGAPSLAQSSDAATLRADAAIAYGDVVSRFWRGGVDDGHPVTTSDTGAPVAFDAEPLAPVKGHFWEYGSEVNLIWAHWKVTGAPEPKRRLAAAWRWVDAIWREADFARCGAGAASVAQDDAAWGAATLLQLHEATGDAGALRDAKALMDCAWGRWHDDALGGGLWYDDSHAAKSSYQGPYILDLLDYHAATGDGEALTRAVGLVDWADRALKRPDGLYWEGIRRDGHARGEDRPGDIHQGGSVTFLEGNMAMAIANARLFALTGEDGYRANAIAAARGIALRERDPGGVLIDDRDAFVDGWSAYQYAAEVAPLVAGDPAAAGAKTIVATANSVMANARGGDGTYGGDWSGPLEGIWAAKNSTNFRLAVAANAAIWPVVAALFAK